MSLNIITITEGDFRLKPQQKVIKAADYSVIEKSTRIIDKAREQANHIIADAQVTFEKEKQRGYQDGLMQSRMEQSEQMLKMVDQSINYLSSMEASLANILMTAVKKIIDGYDDHALTVGLIKAGLQHVRNERQVTVRVPPAHFAHVKASIAEILKNYKGVGILNPVSDPRLKAGSCILESKIGVVDASIDIQLKALQKRFGQLTAHTTEELQNDAQAWAEDFEPSPSVSEESNDNSTEEKPSDPEEKLSDPEEKLSDPEEKPSDPEEKLSDSEEKPSDPEEKLSDSEEKPSDPEEKSSDPEEKLSDPEEKLSDPEEKPSDPEEKLSDSEEKLSDPEEKPSDPEEKPSDDD